MHRLIVTLVLFLKASPRRCFFAIAYGDYVEILDQMCNYLGYNRMAFAKELYNQDLPDRYDWFEDQVRKKLQSDNASLKEYNDVIRYIRVLQGGP